MQKLLIIAASLSLSLTGMANVAFAQDASPEGIITNADGSHVTSTAGVNPTANGEGGTIVYGDINTGPGNTVIGPPSVVQTTPAPAPATEPVETVAEPVYEEPDYDETATAPETTTVATETDLDADNLADDLEWELGLDPTIADVDGDGVADGDELSIYGTDPLAWDTDGDGLADGEELFGLQTDPLLWDDLSSEGVETVAQEAAPEAQQFADTAAAPVQQMTQQGTDENLTATDGDASSLGSGSASSSPGTITRGSRGTSVLGPDGTYRVSETAPANVTVSGDTEVLAPPATAPTDAASSGSALSCSSYGSWYDAQVAYEAAGLTAADPALVAELDPDYDGIACEEGM